MINVIKIGNVIYNDIQPKTVDREGNEHWNIPNDVERLMACLIDTVGWMVTQKIVSTIGDMSKKDASVSKGQVLLAKIIALQNPDLSKLSDTEKAIFEKMNQLAGIGYADSELTAKSFDAIFSHLGWYQRKITEIGNCKTFDELVSFAEELE